MKALADHHLARSYADRFDVGCEGELIDSFRVAASALEFARWSAEITATPHIIFDSATHAPLIVVDPFPPLSAA